MALHASTCWTVIRGAAAGSPSDRDDFVRCYAPIIWAYLSARWRGSAFQQELDDAVQEVFLECFRQGGLLERADSSQPGGFRAFLYGVIRNIALRVEARVVRQRRAHCLDSSEAENVPADEASLSQVFDRAWATGLFREAAQLQAEQARQAGEAFVRRVELLRLRFHEDLPIREIARRWQMAPAFLHREYAKARQEFKAALQQVVTFHHPGSAEEVEQECANLLDLIE